MTMADYGVLIVDARRRSHKERGTHAASNEFGAFTASHNRLESILRVITDWGNAPSLHGNNYCFARRHNKEFALSSTESQHD